jgi:hypothetical protein
MTDRHLLKLLPGGKSSSKPGPDGEAGQRPGAHGHYADPYAIPDGRSPAAPAGTRGHQSGPRPGQQAGPRPGTRGRARLRLLPPIREDGERRLPARYPVVIPAPPALWELDQPAANAASLLALQEYQPDAGSTASPTITTGADRADRPDIGTGAGRTERPRTMRDAGNSAGQDGQTDASRGRTMAEGRHRKPPPRGTGDPEFLAKREIRVLSAAQLLSSAGDQLARVAITVMVYGQTRSPLLTAVAYTLTYLPPLLGGPVTGLTGKLDRRALMIGLDVARAALIAAMALPGTPLWSLGPLLFAAMLLGAPFCAARAALVRDHAPAGPGWMAGPSPAVSTIGYQAGQALGFLAGAGLVAALQPRRTLLIDALTFLASACLVTTLVARRRTPHGPAAGPTLDPLPAAGPTISAGAGIVARSTRLRTLALLGWVAGFYVVPECIAAPYARALGGGTLTVGLLMAAMPAGAVLGVLAFARLIRPAAQAQSLGWLAMLSCVPLIFSALHPPLQVVLALWALAGAGTAYQVGAGVEFLRALGHPGPAGPGSGPSDHAGLPGSVRADHALLSALGFAQAGLLGTQCLGFVAAGAAAQVVGPQAAVALAGLCGLAASTALTRMWRRAHTGRKESGTLARGAAGRGAVSADN